MMRVPTDRRPTAGKQQVYQTVGSHRWLGQRWQYLTPIVLLILLASCGQVARTSRVRVPTATLPPPTATALPAMPLRWRQASLPLQSSSSGQFGIAPGHMVAVAPSDGKTAYVCATITDESDTAPVIQPRVWLTHDYAATWTEVASIPADSQNNGCTIEVDASNPAITVAILTWTPRGSGAGPDDTKTTNFATFDAGLSWTKLTGAQPFQILQLATWRGTVYALRAVLLGTAIADSLWASSDNMQTWRDLTLPLPKYTYVSTFWLAPSTGEILVELDDPQGPSQLWDTTDGGQSWKMLPAPPVVSNDPRDMPNFVAWMPGSSQSWHICSTAVPFQTTSGLADQMSCSMDGGHTWVQRPGLTASFATDPSNTTGQFATAIAVASDGAILAILPAFGSPTDTLLRLSPGSPQWQSLGTSGGLNFVMYRATPGNGVLWETFHPLQAPSVAVYP